METGNDLNGIVQTIKELEDSRNAYSCANQKLAQTVHDLEDELENYEQIQHEDKMLIDEQQSTIQTLTHENKALQSTLKLKEVELDELRHLYRDMEDLQRENDNLLKNKAVCEIQRCKLAESINELEEVVKEKDFTIGRQEAQLGQMQMKLNDYRKSMDTLTEENENLTKRYEECKTNLKDATMENDRLVEKQRLCDMGRQKLEETNKKNCNYIKQLKNELAKENTLNHKAQNKISELEEEQNKSKRKIDQLKAENMNLQEDLHDKHNDIENLRAELKRKTEEFENYKNTICSLKQKIMTNRDNTPAPICTVYGGRSRSNHRKSRLRTQQISIQCLDQIENSYLNARENSFCTQVVEYAPSPSGYVSTVGDYCGVGNDYRADKEADYNKIGDCADVSFSKSKNKRWRVSRKAKHK